MYYQKHKDFGRHMITKGMMDLIECDDIDEYDLYGDTVDLARNAFKMIDKGKKINIFTSIFLILIDKYRPWYTPYSLENYKLSYT